MFVDRMKQYRFKFERPVRRSAEVRSICGTYKVSALPDDINKMSVEYTKLLESGGTRCSFSRWLMLTKGVSSVDVGKICKCVAETKDITVVISDRYNDLLRLADTKHYTSCLTPGMLGRLVPIKLLRDPDIGVMYIADKSGKFAGRTVFKAGRIYQIFRCYGTMSFELATKVLEKLGKRVNTTLDDLAVTYGY